MRSWIELSDPERERNEVKPERLQQAGHVAHASKIRQITELTDRRFLPEGHLQRLTQKEFESELQKFSAN